MRRANPVRPMQFHFVREQRKREIPFREALFNGASDTFREANYTVLFLEG